MPAARKVITDRGLRFECENYSQRLVRDTRGKEITDAPTGQITNSSPTGLSRNRYGRPRVPYLVRRQHNSAWPAT